MTTQSWQARIEGVMQAHFKQDDGTSRPGADYKLGLKQGDNVCQIFVRAYLSDDLTPQARKDVQYQQQTVIGYVFDRLTPEWRPTGEMFPFPALTILNPSPGYTASAPPPVPKRGFLGKLLGR